MLTITGTYKDGIIMLDEKSEIKGSKKVLVTFIDEDKIIEYPKKLSTKDFSFMYAREKAHDYNGSLSDAVLEDRDLQK